MNLVVSQDSCVISRSAIASVRLASSVPLSAVGSMDQDLWYAKAGDREEGRCARLSNQRGVMEREHMVSTFVTVLASRDSKRALSVVRALERGFKDCMEQKRVSIRQEFSIYFVNLSRYQTSMGNDLCQTRLHLSSWILEGWLFLCSCARPCS